VKDPAIVWAGGRWHLLFSYVTDDPSLPGGVRWDIATAASTDMVHWSAVDPWPAQRGVSGVASPDIVR
jgi:sucrose-6-phosphate hydrolase SacC (GH32 family)